MTDTGQNRESLKRALRECVVEACAEIARRSAGQQPYMEEKRVWERQEDGSYVPRRAVMPYTAIMFARYMKWEELETYQRATDIARTDPQIGPQMDALVGGENIGSMRVEPRRLVEPLVRAMVRGDGRLEFNEAVFREKLEEILGEFDARELTRITVAPLPNIVAPWPVRLAEGVELDRLTDDEVASCADAGLLGMFPGIEYVAAGEAVGMRCLGRLRKTVNAGGPNPYDEGLFGRRPGAAQHLLVNDVLSTLRLLKGGRVRATGQVSYVQGGLLGGWRNYARGSMWAFNQYELRPEDVGELQGLWAILAGGEIERRRFLATSLRRFNLALERDLIEDRMVDLMISGESLFLEDGGDGRERGEQRYRLALRAAAFADSSRPEVFRVMREGYDARSIVVHGRVADKFRLPGKPQATLSEVAEAVEGVMRFSLRKAFVTPELGRAGFWESVILPS